MPFDAFDGPAENFVADWVNGRLGPRKTKNGAISREQIGPVDTLFSYAVPIASIFDRKYIVFSTRGALSRTSLTTNKHLKWVSAAIAGKGADPGRPREWLPRLTPFQEEQVAEVTDGRIPVVEQDWGPVLVMFDQRNETKAPSGRLRGFDGSGEAIPILHDWLERHRFSVSRIAPLVTRGLHVTQFWYPGADAWYADEPWIVVVTQPESVLVVWCAGRRNDERDTVEESELFDSDDLEGIQKHVAGALVHYDSMMETFR